MVLVNQALVCLDGEVVYQHRDGINPYSVADVERIAALDPSADWRIYTADLAYQRRAGRWVCVEEN
jgi:hypothetical protein